MFARKGKKLKLKLKLKFVLVELNLTQLFAQTPRQLEQLATSNGLLGHS